jgi:protein SCO1
MKTQIKLHRVFMWGVFAFVLVGVSFTYLWTELKEKPEATNLPRFGAVPEFSLMERSGVQVSLSSLKGKVWIADFIFTNCAASCPMMTSMMSTFQAPLKKYPDILLLSFSVDPDRDSIEALRQYANAYHASKDKWLFLRGPKKEIYPLVQEGFHLSVAQDTGYQILHSTKFVLVDKQGIIRGYYDYADSAVGERLLRDAKVLSEEKLI